MSYLRILKNRFPELIDQIPGGAHHIAKAYIEATGDIARDKVPVDWVPTGSNITLLLHDSIHTDDQSSGSKITIRAVADAPNINDDPYGRYQEFGTSRHKAQPFFTPAALAAEPVIAREAKALIRG